MHLSRTVGHNPGIIVTSVATAILALAAWPAETSGGGFRVEGTNIYDPDGNRFIPIGGNMNGYNWGWVNPTLEPRHIDSLVDEWGFNTIRLNNYIKGYHRQQRWWEYGDFKPTFPS